MRNPSSSSSSSKAGATSTVPTTILTSSSSTSKAAPGGTKTPCCTKVGLKRGPWTPEEDELLANYIKKEGEGRWRTLPKRAGLLRCGKSCRLRWMNYLRPSVKRGQIAPDEEDLILRLHRLLGNRWSLIAGRIPGRTDNEIKNYWNTHLSKKLISQGIDPRTHKPLVNINPDHHHHQSSSSADHHEASSSKTNQNHHNYSSNPSPNNNNTSDLVLAPAHDRHREVNPNITNKETGYLENDHLGAAVGYADTHAPLPAAAMGTLNLRSSNNNSSHNVGGSSGVLLEGEDEDMINGCSDDVFSSFLNSLINEDPFAGQHQLQQQVLHHGQNAHAAAAAAAGSEHLPNTSSTSNAPSATFGWESAVLMSSAFIQNDPHRVITDQAE